MNEKHIAYLEEQILKTLSNANYAFFELRMQSAYTGGLEEEDFEEGSSRTKFEGLVKKLCKLFVVYFECKALTSYLADFKKEVLPIVEEKSILYNSEISEETGDETSTVIGLLWLYLTPFEFAHGNMHEVLSVYSGVHNLTRILTKSQPILSRSGVKPVSKSELFDILRIF